jgi:hypothetical protein
VTLEPELVHEVGEQPRPDRRERRLGVRADGPRTCGGGERATGRHAQDRTVDQARLLLGEHVHGLGDVPTQADDVGVDPPAPARPEQVVAEDVREGTDRLDVDPGLVEEDRLAGEDSFGFLHPTPLRNVRDVVVDVEHELVLVLQERRDREPLDRRQLAAVPERLEQHCAEPSRGETKAPLSASLEWRSMIGARFADCLQPRRELA